VTSPRACDMLAEFAGVYMKDNDIAPVDDAAATSPGVAPHAVDPESGWRLWELGERLIKA
jgi:hypothetical protein